MKRQKGIFSMSENNENMQNYMYYRSRVYQDLMPGHVEMAMISERNHLQRCQLSSSENLGIQVKQGDICYTDFGQGYLYECAFQHFGLVLSIYGSKALLVPMTSNTLQYRNAYDPNDNPSGRKHLMRIGLIPGMRKHSVLFLNDLKYVNTARVIDIMGRIDPGSDLFIEIQTRILRLIMSDGRITTCLKRIRENDM